ncbi:MAG TPA: bacillithiol biosynthesis cysteine-adding enzyme BshC [Myxococcaceae bacterium]|nr:bacillithiol biosynthesis cysteine-adding enzyme BshC [Myxococcaceae bacterium]
MASDFFAQFTAGEATAAALLPTHPLEPAAWESAASAAARRAPVQGVVEELQRQASALPPSAARDANLAALTQPGAVCVVTGQQLGVFLGTLYTLHKAATAVARARWLGERTGRPCVPVFWLQTEDHDWAEIARFDGCVRGEWISGRLPPEPAAEARVSIAQRRLPREVKVHCGLLARSLGPLPHGAEVAQLVCRHYLAGRSPGAAFAGLLAELFSAEGLVLLDPRTPAFAALAAPVVRLALEEQGSIAAALEARGQLLAVSGFEEQVHTRSAASLAFFHPEGPAGPRFRPLCEGDRFRTPLGTFTLPELRARLAADPLSFSTSALLRPLVQDTLLPTAAYLGGPAECTYFAQLPPVYALAGMEMPMVAPRARFRVVDPWTAAQLEALGLEAADVEQRPAPELAARIHAFPEWMDGSLRQRLLAPVERELEALRPRAVAVNPALARSIEKTRAHVARGVDRLLGRLQRRVLESRGAGTEALGRLESLITVLRPGGLPQERVHGFWGVAAEVGPRALVSALVAAARPLSPEVRTVRP